MSDILDKIAAYKREEVSVRKAARPAVDISVASPPRGFRAALERAHAPGRLALRAKVLTSMFRPMIDLFGTQPDQ